jgi:hypothetical protein
MEPKRLGFIRVSKELLREALQLPADADIQQAKWIWERDTLLVKFASEQCPVVAEGQEIPWVNL